MLQRIQIRCSFRHAVVNLEISEKALFRTECRTHIYTCGISVARILANGPIGTSYSSAQGDVKPEEFFATRKFKSARGQPYKTVCNIITRQLPMGADHCPLGGYTDRIVCNIHGEEHLVSRYLFKAVNSGQFLRKYIWIFQKHLEKCL